MHHPSRAGLFIVCMWMVLTLGSCGPTTFVVGVGPGGHRAVATAVERDGRLGSRHIAVIEVSGMIANADQPGLLSSGPNPVAALTEMLDHAATDPRIAAVVLRLNTPGGTVTASDMMYREVLRFRQRTGKPVVASMMDIATSGGYYVACAADEIVAYPTTVTGSIGVVMQTFSVDTAMKKLGIESNAIVSGPNKTAGSPFERLDVEQRRILQNMVDDFYARFRAVVKQARPNIPEDQWDTVTDGRVFTGEQALELGLVDQLGDLREAIAAAKKRADLGSADVLVYHRPLDHVATPYASSPDHVAGGAMPTNWNVNLLQLNLGGAGKFGGVGGRDAGFYYLWSPGDVGR